MKKVYIPAGEIVTYNALHTDRLVVKGMLRISGKLVAKEITGGGIVEAREIICDDLRLSSATADFVTARRIAADKLFVQFECRASEQIAVRDYLTAGYVSTGRLSVSLSEVGACDADEIITVRQRGSMLGLLWASWWRGLFLDLFHGGVNKEKSEKRKKAAPASEEMPSKPTSGSGSDVLPVMKKDAADGDTIDLLITVLTDLKEMGYRVSKTEPASTSGEETAA